MTHPAAAAVARCRRPNVRARLVAGGLGTGNDFGFIVAWNVGTTRCRIAGAVTFSAYFSDGRRDGQAQPNRQPPPVDVVLPAGMPTYRDGSNQAGYLVAELMGPERDDPRQPDGLCRDQDKLAPATLVLGLGPTTLRVANADGRSRQATQVYGCHGRVLLEHVGQARGQSAFTRRCGTTATTATYNTSALLTVQFVDATTGWVVTGDGVIATTDGGVHWQRQLKRRIRSHADVDFVDRAHGWLVADGQLLTTVDGGHHWTALAWQCPRISKVHFYTSRDGYAVTGSWRRSGTWRPGPLLRTHDGGRSWSRVDTPPQPQDICMADTAHGWLAAGGEIYRTTDAAHTWTLVEAGARHARRFTPTAELQCSGPDDAWALITGGVGMSQQAHIAFHVHDQDSFPIYAEGYFPHPGVDTNVESPGSYAGPFSAIGPATAVFVDYCPACGAGTAPLAITDDGGRTLQRRHDLPALSQAMGASFVNADDGWVIGVQQLWRRNHHIGVRYRILHTDDGARHWTTQRVRTRYDR